jgi:hypothetical protein
MRLLQVLRYSPRSHRSRAVTTASRDGFPTEGFPVRKLLLALVVATLTLGAASGCRSSGGGSSCGCGK